MRDLNAPVDRLDDRRIEVIANGLLLWNGAQLAVDTTIVSPLTRDAVPRSRHDFSRPVAFLRSSRCRLVVVGVEVGGRWSTETADFLRQLARAKARDAPAALRLAYQAALVHRWSGFLTAAAMQAFAASLSVLPSAGLSCLDGPAPALSDVLADRTGPVRCSPAGSRHTLSLSLAFRVGALPCEPTSLPALA